MKKIGKLIAPLVLALALTGALAPESVADDIRVSASVSENIVFVGENFVLSIEATGPSMQTLPRPQMPTIDGLRLLSNIPAISTSMSVVNNVATATYGLRYTFRAERAGTFTIPAFTFSINGRTHTTEPIRIEAVERGSGQAVTERPEIFLQLELSEPRPYVGQQVTANLVLYFRNDIDIISYQPASSWRTEGFWIENLNEGGANPRAESVLLDGVRYRKATLISYALFPTRAGNLRLGSYEIRANIRYSGRYDQTSPRVFMGFGRSQRSVDIASQEREISIRSLPSPQPETFTGGVGRFEVKRDISTQSVLLGEPVEVVTTFEGTGNVFLINQPKKEFPEEFEAFAPQENTDIRKAGETVSGVKSFTDILIPRRTGSFEIPATRVSWFDDRSARYVTRELPAISLTVLRDPNDIIAHVEQVQLNLRPVTGVTLWHRPAERGIVPGFWFWGLVGLPFLVLIGAWLRRRHLDRLRNDIAFSRRTMAMEQASKRLGKADESAQLGDWRDAYGMLHKAISVFIADMMNLPASGLSDKEIAEAARTGSGSDELGRELGILLVRFSTIQYAPETGEAAYQKDRKNTEALIRKLKRAL